MNLSEYKILFVGSSHVGKTSIINRYFYNLNDLYSQQWGTIFKTMRKVINKYVEVKLKIRDTVEEERLDIFNDSFCKNLNAVVLIYDITDKKTFNKIDFWYEKIKEKIKLQNLHIILIGNKNDSLSQRKVSFEEGEIKKKELKLNDFLETSAKTKDNIEELFLKLGNYFYEEEKCKSIQGGLFEDSDQKGYNAFDLF